jgi:hypothetical protein
MRAEQYGALGMVAVALAVTSWLALHGNEQAAGVMQAIVTSGTAFYLRGRVQTPKE